MKISVLVLIPLIIGAPCQEHAHVAAATTKQNIAHYQITVKSVVKVATEKNRISNLVTYEFGFPGRKEIHINGLGTVDPVGAYKYITTSDNLEFTDPQTRELLTIRPLKETVIVAGSEPLREIPEENLFSETFRSFDWTARQSLKQRLNNVLNSYFYYKPHDVDGTTFFITTYAKLDIARPGVLARIALLISFPYSPTKNAYSFRIHALVQEGRTKGDGYRDTKDPEILAIGDKFVMDLAANIMKQ